MSNQKSYQLGEVHIMLVHDSAGATGVESALAILRGFYPEAVMVGDGHYDDKTHSWKFFVA